MSTNRAGTEDDGCPNCGSLSLRRVEGVVASEAGRVDLATSGRYMCERCGEESYYEAPARWYPPNQERLPVFCPTAQCPGCQLVDTRVTTTLPDKRKRRHKCNNCGRVFYTSYGAYE